MNDNPSAILVDVSGGFLAVTASLQIPNKQSGLMGAGVGDDGVIRFIGIDSNRALKTTGSFNITNNSLTVTGSIGIGTPGVVVTNIPTVTGTVSLSGTSSVVIASLPNVTGAVNITNSVLSVTGNIGIGTPGVIVNSLPSITGSVASTMFGPSATGVLTAPQVDKILGQSVNQISVASTITSPGAATHGAYAYVNAYGSLRVSPESTALFNEPFDGLSLDSNRWISAASGSGAGVTIGGGSASISAGANASSYAYLQSVPTFIAYGTTFEIYGAVATFFGATTNCYKFFGIGSPKANPTAALPLFDGVGFEQDITGSLTAVVYNSGTLAYKSSPLAAPGTVPGRYGFHLRSDLILFYYPTSEFPIASVSFTGSYVQQLSILNLAVNNTSAPGVTSGIKIQNQSINDSGKNSIAIADATYPWRKASVDSSGSLFVTGSVASTTTPQLNSNSSVTRVNAVTSSTTLIASNTTRKFVTVYNDSPVSLYLKLGTSATTSSFTLRMTGQSYYEVPPYNGTISGFWLLATGSALLTELT